jgi:CRISPR-associated endonuclease/helicase Cas3
LAYAVAAETLDFIGALWAKSPSSDPLQQENGYPLLPHLLDVAAVAASLLEAVPCPVPLPIDESWVMALVGLHDLGKASPGFQVKLGRTNVGGYRLERYQPDRHDIITVGLLANCLKDKGLPVLGAERLSHAVAAHHGHPFTSDEVSKQNRWEISEQWACAHAALYNAVVNGTGATGQLALPTDASNCSAMLQWLMGLTTTSDWIGSSDALCRWERLPEWQGDPQVWFQSSLTLAKDAVQRLGLISPSIPPATDGLAAVQLVLGNKREPRDLQVATAAMLDALPQEPALIVIEAPMGEGKTEAALSCASGSRGVYVAMPTQATSNALFPRLASYLAAQVLDSGSYPIALAHGSGGASPATLKLREIGLGTVDSTVQANWWFQGSKRALLCAQGIGTVDQSLIGVLNTRHGFLRLYGLSGRTVIFDEVHAYDAYTGGLIERLIAWLKVLNCRVVVMSATLPATRRQSLLQAWSGMSKSDKDVAAYPRLSWAVNGQQESVGFAANRQQQVAVFSINREVDFLAKQVNEWVRQGARVLVVVNKVARAQSLFCRLDPNKSTLFHARYPMQQRLEIEQGVLKRFGPVGSFPSGHVLVATQVAEQSLDIDFDVLITDPAPVDLVLQRQGRIHRHNRLRPEAFRQPCIHVVELEESIPSPELTSFVYSDWDVLRSTAWLREHRMLTLPEDIDLAVQDVYGTWAPSGNAALMEALAQAEIKHTTELANMQSNARQAGLSKPQDWRIDQGNKAPLDDDAAETGALRFGTRLGHDSQSVVPVQPDDLIALEQRAPDLAKRHLRISHPALVASSRQAELPEGWRQHGGLACHRPLLLDADRLVINSTVAARLDPVLGLVVGEVT